MSDRLTRDMWIAHGFQVLKADGHEALKADKLVKTLGVSRGSFYWHFQNLAAFHEAVLLAWRRQIIERVIAELKQLPDGATQLEELMSQVLRQDQALEAAVRRWAGADSKVAKAVNEVDRVRTRFMRHVFMQSGFSESAAEARAHFLGWAYVDMATNTSLGQYYEPQWAAMFAKMILKPE